MPNDSLKRNKRGKANHLKTVSPQKISERHAISLGQDPSGPSTRGTIFTFFLFKPKSAKSNICV